jgi:hypothetical protein
VRQGGILGTELYKVYVNTLLDRISESGLGYKTGAIPVLAPMCADDITLISDNPGELQTLINMAVDYSRMERYILQPAKSVVMTILPSSYPTEISEIQSWTLGDRPMPKVDQSTHMGILRATTSATSAALSENMCKGRRTAYMLMSAGLHGKMVWTLRLPATLSCYMFCPCYFMDWNSYSLLSMNCNR